MKKDIHIELDTVDFVKITREYVPQAMEFVDAIYKAAEGANVPAKQLNNTLGEIALALRILEKHAAAISNGTTGGDEDVAE